RQPAVAPAPAPVAQPARLAPAPESLNAADPATADRAALRSVLETSERAQTAVAPQAAPAEAAPTVENLTKAELLRRERMRKELANEDLLQARLEELRLRDENKRSQELLNGQADAGTPAPGAPVAAPVETQVIGEVPPGLAPITTTQAAPVAATVPAATGAPAVGVVAETPARSWDEPENTRVSIQPRGGFANMAGTQDYTLNSRFAAGVGADIEVSDNLAFQVGYAYSEYGVSLQSTSYTVATMQAYSRNPEPVVMKQNVADAGLKMSLMGRDSKLRPFLGGGAAFAKSFINYDERALQALRASGQTALAQDYDLSQFLGYLSTGFDLKLSKSVSVGATFKYYAVLSSRENQSLNNMGAFYSPYYNPYSYNYAYGQDADKQQVSGSLSRANFYSILGGVTFTF
ncbi:MAG TPA: hypothetical protein VL588_10525, partial [Bdellovibrionota bacterium]|nr:hypothetical protein [Bdellovibrionota bacterium]